MNSHYASLYKQASIIDISIILDHFKVKYDRSFDYLISCPIPSHIHQSNTPSFKVYKNTNSFYCFGCKAAGGPVHLTKHMLGVKTVEEALDYLSKNFNLKTKSLAKSFFNISKNLKSTKTEVSPDLVVEEKFSSFIFLLRSARSSSIKCSPRKLAEIYDAFYYVKRSFINNTIDRETFYKDSESILGELKLLLSECQEKDCVIDAENQ